LVAPRAGTTRREAIDLMDRRKARPMGSAQAWSVRPNPTAVNDTGGDASARRSSSKSFQPRLPPGESFCSAHARPARSRFA